MVQTDTLQYQCKGVIYYFLSTLLLALTFFCYIIGSTILPVMDIMGWLFFVLSCLSHAAIIMLLPLAGYALLARLRQPWVAGVWFVTSVSLLLVLTMLNLQVYQLYRFHINGIILNMVFGSGASEIFNFDAAVLAKEGGILLLFVVAALGLWRLVPTLVRHTSRGKLWSMAAFLMLSILASNAIHVYGAFFQKPSVMKSRALLPYYFPLTATSALRDLGCQAPVNPIADHHFHLHRLVEQAHTHARNDAQRLSCGHRESVV